MSGLAGRGRRHRLGGMKASQALLLCALAIMLVSTGWARIGETLAQCEERYGRPSPGKPIALLPGSETYSFTKAGMEIFCVLLDEKVVAIQYQKETKDILGHSEKMSDVELQKLLDSNSPGVWKKVHSGVAAIFKSEDNSLMARFDRLKNQLFIFTEEANDKLEGNQAEKQKDNLEGF
jgi:hypothetical protein